MASTMKQRGFFAWVWLLLAIVGHFGQICWTIPPLWEQPADFGDPSSLPDKPSSPFVTDRLTVTLTPNLYRLEIRPILENGAAHERFTAPGKIWITGTCTMAENYIMINQNGINITENQVTVQNDNTGAALSIVSTESDPLRQFFTVTLSETLVVGTNYTLYVPFTSTVQTKLRYGLWASAYRDNNGQQRYIASTDFQAPEARRAFPCMDEPHLKAVWEISIIRTDDYHSLSNMGLLRTEPAEGLAGWSKDTFHPTLPMSTYLICFAVSDFLSASASDGIYRLPVQVWGPPPMMEQGHATFSPNFSAQLMQFFESYYNISYAFPKMDKISIPDFSAGAMENWGLNTYRDTRLLYEEGVSTAQDMFSMTNTISHEIVHQWWGNLVTCWWWDDLWVQEGAATYYAPIGVAAVHPELEPEETLIWATVQRALAFDASSKSHPIHNEGLDPENQIVLFDTLTYHKGASLIRMMVAFLTAPLYKAASTNFMNKLDLDKTKFFGILDMNEIEFNSFLHFHNIGDKEYSHISQCEYQAASQFDFFEALDKDREGYPIDLLPAGSNVSSIMEGWTLQHGFPLVRVVRNQFTNIVNFTQEPFYANAESDPGGDNRTWTIPIAIRRSTDSTESTAPVTWLLPDEPFKTYRVNEPWFIVNPQTVGYFRVLYDDVLWNTIIGQLKTDHTVFNVQTRSALVDDALAEAYAGYLPMHTALDLTLYLQKERELHPWATFVNNMAQPYRIFAQSSSLSSFAKYVLDLMAGLVHDITFQHQVGEPHPRTLLRTRMVEWTCNLGLAECTNFATTSFHVWMNDPTNTSVKFPISYKNQRMKPLLNKELRKRVCGKN